MKQFLLILLFLTSCSKYCIATKSKVWLEKMSWVAMKDANSEKDSNNGMPIKVNLIYVYDEEYYKKLSEKTSQEYFENFETLKKEFGNKVEVFEFDVVPGDSKDNIDIFPSKCNAAGAILFARYNSSERSEKYINIAEDSELRLVFKKDKPELLEEKD